MTVAFSLNGLFLCLVPVLGSTSSGFVIVTSLALFTGGEIFALFPALTSDLFGARYAAANQGMLYTAKGIAALAGGALAAWLGETKSWNIVFAAAGSLAILSAVMMVALPNRAQPSPGWVGSGGGAR
jgi:OFA family oxalate/formate antiporter-like MFS transporter